MMKPMPAVEKSTTRRLATSAVMSRPRMLTVMLSPTARPISSASSAAKLTSGGPAYSSGHHAPAVITVPSGGVAE